jgi:hypothetical protein
MLNTVEHDAVDSKIDTPNNPEAKTVYMTNVRFLGRDKAIDTAWAKLARKKLIP